MCVFASLANPNACTAEPSPRGSSTTTLGTAKPHSPCAVPTSSRSLPCQISALIASGALSLSLTFAAATLLTSPSTTPLLLKAVTSCTRHWPLSAALACRGRSAVMGAKAAGRQQQQHQHTQIHALSAARHSQRTINVRDAISTCRHTRPVNSPIVHGHALSLPQAGSCQLQPQAAAAAKEPYLPASCLTAGRPGRSLVPPGCSPCTHSSQSCRHARPARP